MRDHHKRMADWAKDSHVGCGSILSCCLLHGERVVIEGSLLDDPSVLGPLLSGPMSRDIAIPPLRYPYRVIPPWRG